MKQNSRGAILLIPLIFLASVAFIIISFSIINNSQQVQKPSQTAKAPPTTTTEPTATPYLYPSPNQTIPDNKIGLKYTGNHFSIVLLENWEIDKQTTTTSQAGVNNLEIARFTTQRSTHRPQIPGDIFYGWADINIKVTTLPIEKLIYSGFQPEQVIFKGKQAFKQSGFQGIAGSVYIINVITNANGITYLIGMSTQDLDLQNQFVTEFDQILSTFQFLD